MAADSYKKKQRRLLQCFDKVETDLKARDSDVSIKEDELEIQYENSNTEQDILDIEIEQAMEPKGNRRFRRSCFIENYGTI